MTKTPALEFATRLLLTRPPEPTLHSPPTHSRSRLLVTFKPEACLHHTQAWHRIQPSYCSQHAASGSWRRRAAAQERLEGQGWTGWGPQARVAAGFSNACMADLSAWGSAFGVPFHLRTSCRGRQHASEATAARVGCVAAGGLPSRRAASALATYTPWPSSRRPARMRPRS